MNGKTERTYVVLTRRDDLLVTQELVRLLATEKPNSLIILACPAQLQDGTQKWIDNIQAEAQNALFKVLTFDPDGDLKTCREAATKLINSIASCCTTIDGLISNWHGCIPGRFGVVADDSGMLEMAQIKIMGQLYLIEGLIEKKILSDQSRVVVAGSEAARGIISMKFPVPKFGYDLDSFVNMLNGSSLDKELGNPIYGHVQAILSLYIGKLSQLHPQIYFCSLSPGFTQDSLNPNLVIESGTAPPKIFYWLFWMFGIAQSYSTSARNFYRAGTGTDWPYPSGVLVAAEKGTCGPVCDQSTLSDGQHLGDKIKQDLAYEALHKFA